MNKNDFHTIEKLFHDVLQLDSDEERRRILDEKCQNDDKLRSRMSSILRAHGHAKDYLETDAVFDHINLLTSIFSPRSESAFDESEIIKFLEPPVQEGTMGRLGHYEIQEVIGYGATGVVLGGTDSRLDRPVAVKLLASQLALDSVARKRFMREARIAASLKHDHIVTIFDVDSSGRLPYIVMEKVDGESLFDLLKRKCPLEIPQIIKFTHQIASGLAYAHAHGVIHRDIKPSNILLETSNQRVKITDFGLARSGDEASLTRTGQCAGTPTFMSPEQARGETVDARSDLFSLGCTMYAMCTGKSPFEGDSTFTVMRQVCEAKPQSITELNKNVPRWLTVIVDALLEKDPNKRIKSAEKLESIMRKCRNRISKGKPIEFRSNEKEQATGEKETKEPVIGSSANAGSKDVEVHQNTIAEKVQLADSNLLERQTIPSVNSRRPDRRYRKKNFLIANIIGVAVFGLFGLYVGGLILNQHFDINVMDLFSRSGEPDQLSKKIPDPPELTPPIEGNPKPDELPLNSGPKPEKKDPEIVEPGLPKQDIPNSVIPSPNEPSAIIPDSDSIRQRSSRPDSTPPVNLGEVDGPNVASEVSTILILDQEHIARATIENSTFVPLSIGQHLYSDDGGLRKWDNIPRPYRGWEFTQLGKHHGRSTIHVTETGILHLLVFPPWGAGGSAGPWENELTTREELLEQGWHSIENFTGHNPHVDQVTSDQLSIARPNGGPGDCELWAKQFDAGATFSLRIAKYAAPLVIQPTTDSTRSPGSFQSLQESAKVFSDRNYIWTKIPDQLKDAHFWQTKALQETAWFQVERAGNLYLTVFFRKESDKLSGGPWESEINTKQDLLNDGWVEFNESIEEEEDGTKRSWTVFSRDCKMGERFFYRTDKYAIPIPVILKKR